MLLKKITIAVLLFSPLSALASTTTQWEVRTTGNDANGGAFDNAVTSPGTDYSQQDAAQVAFTDLVIGGTTTGYLDVGAVQSQSTGGGGTASNYGFVQ